MEVTCTNGHENPPDRQFCGECGTPMVAIAAMCPVGHVNAEHQRFCGECGAPTVAPDGLADAASGGRWAVDPTGTHQYRYWHGDAWTEHVADNGTFSTEPIAKPGRRRFETWISVAAGAVTLVLLVGAMTDIGMQLSRDAKPAAPQNAPASTTDNAPAPAAVTAASDPSDAATPAPPGPEQAVSVIATLCRPNSSNGVTADGSVAYCERLTSTDTYLWSLFPGDIPLPPGVGLGTDQSVNPAVGVCMAQTGRTSAGCLEYLARPSNPGDGHPGN